ncbi:uncharacterized protein LOC122293600 [Carya illinoinensis]|uniref:uncharacterized protein LOC122293600 n=1 Tax=Carya illinoinensis TaxID=32201 RepID=UPI001C7262EC|nr:uncharacterized protein LOC122293600 [Carya illinoinensis]
MERAGIEMIMDTQAWLSSLTLGSSLIDQIKVAQNSDPGLVKIKGEVPEDKRPEFSISGDGTLRFKGKIYVPNVKEIRDVILKKAHRSLYTVHPGSTKMYRDLKQQFWWSGFPKAPGGQDAAWVIIDRLSKSAHFIPVQMTYSTEKLAELYVREIVRLHGIPSKIVSDRDIVSLQCSGEVYQESIQAAPYEVLYGRKCRSPLYWDEVGERRILGQEIIQNMREKIVVIRKRLAIAQEQQKRYADQRCRELQFEVGSKVFLKIAPMKGIMRFRKKGKLSSRYFGPFDVLERIGATAYRLALPPRLSAIHDVFHISMLREYIPDPTHILEYEPLQVREDLTYEEFPVGILAQRTQVLCKKTISMVKVLWSNHTEKEATWELEEDMKHKYPYLFD